jgi:hypothetical protein
MKLEKSVLAAGLALAFGVAGSVHAQTETVVVTKETPVVMEKTTQKTVIVEQPVVRVPILVKEQVLVPVGGKIGKDVVHAVLASSGYHDIHDIDWLSTRGVWKAEARDATGDDREIHVDPYDGSILHVEED